MESTNNNNNNQSLFLSELKELRNELSAMKTRIDQLEESNEKQQERLDILERENHMLKKKTELNTLNDIKEGGSTLKRKRTEKDEDQVHEKKIESRSTSPSVSAGKDKKTKTNNDDDNEAVVISQRDNGDSFDSLSDDLLHKIAEFDGNCYSKFGLINKRCRNIYDVKEYKLNKATCLFGYGTVDMMLERYLHKRREGSLEGLVEHCIADAVIIYKRFDALDWIIQLGDIKLLNLVCCFAARYGRITLLSQVFLKFNLTTLDQILNDGLLCFATAQSGELKTLKWLRKYGATLNAGTFFVARNEGHGEVVQYLRSEGCTEPTEDRDESPPGSEQLGSDNEHGDY